jgi:hypothetical protein
LVVSRVLALVLFTIQVTTRWTGLQGDRERLTKVPVTTRRGCCAGGARDGDDLEKAGSGGLNGVDSRKASGGFLKQQQKKKKKKKKSGRKSTESSFDLVSGFSLVDVYYYRPL